MESPAMISDKGYNLWEIWQYPMSKSRIRKCQFGPKLGGGVKRRCDGENEATRLVSTSNGNGMNNGCGKRLKALKGRDENHDSKAKVAPSSGKLVEQKLQPPKPPKQDYIRVRARKGQAINNHNLVKKLLAKHLSFMIINYIHSLQGHVEFLSMKLETINSRMNFGIEVFPPKDNTCLLEKEPSLTISSLKSKGRAHPNYFSMANKHLILPVWHLVHKQRGNKAVVHHHNGYILVVVLKEQHNLEKTLVN
ncbi:Big petal p-like protein [Theobroma cacao]|uniref:Big petal p-like protein n=1 Tax=Theobroma cacao TaxID=3641 RepID=A0A061E5M2_THECC|nr:Big petal p-like protein [Theobroma cacao]